MSNGPMKQIRKHWHVALTFTNTALLFIIVVVLLLDRNTPIPPTKGPQRVKSSTLVSSGAPAPTGTEKEPQADIRQAPQKGAGTIEGLIQHTMEPLKKASLDFNGQGDLPTDEQINAAIRSGTLESDASELVIEKLKEGYSKYNMPFPSLQLPTDIKEEEAEEQVSGTGSQKELETWVNPTVRRLKEVFSERGMEVSRIPTEDEIQAAVSSSSFTSPESKKLIATLRDLFEECEINFPEPQEKFRQHFSDSTPKSQVSKPTESRVPAVAGLSPEQSILRAYFKGQIQRLETEAERQSASIDSFLPSADEVSAAVESSSIKSDESKKVIAKIKRCYDSLGISFFVPAGAE